MPRGHQNPSIEIALAFQPNLISGTGVIVLLFEKSVQADDRTTRRVELVEVLAVPHEPPVDDEDRQRDDFDSRTQPDVLEAELLDVVDQAATAGFPARRLPQQARRVDEIAEQDGRRDVAEQPEYHKLHAESEGALFFRHGPQDYHQQRHLRGRDDERHEEQENQERKDCAARLVARPGGGDGYDGHLPKVGVGVEGVSLRTVGALVNLLLRDVRQNAWKDKKFKICWRSKVWMDLHAQLE